MNINDFIYTEGEEYEDLMNIFQTAKNREYINNKHKHHIVPRHCFNKYNIDIDNSSENLIYLSIGEHCLVHYYYYILGKEKWFKEANNSSWKMLMKIYLGEVYEECKDNIVLMKLFCDTIDKKEYTYKSYERSEETKRKNGDANRGTKNGMYGKCGEKHHFFGKHHSDESKKKMSESHKGQIPPNKGKPMSEETKKKISESLKGKPSPNKGKHLSEEHKKKLSEAESGEKHHMFGKHLSEETKKKISESLKGKPSPNKGKHLSEETKKKISEANKGRKMSEETIEKNRIAHLGKVSKKKIKVIQFSTDMVFIREWDSATDVEKELGFFKSNIRKCCRGERKSAYGFIWKYS